MSDLVRILNKNCRNKFLRRSEDGSETLELTTPFLYTYKNKYKENLQGITISLIFITRFKDKHIFSIATTYYYLEKNRKSVQELGYSVCVFIREVAKFFFSGLTHPLELLATFFF